MIKTELVEMEFKAYSAINKFVRNESFLFDITKTEEGYELKNQNNFFKVVEENGKWYLVVIIDDKEYFFDGSNSKFPFKTERHYNGWNVFFDGLTN